MFKYKNQTEAYRVQPNDTIYPDCQMINPKGKILFKVLSAVRVDAENILFRLTLPGSLLTIPYKCNSITTLKGVFAVNN